MTCQIILYYTKAIAIRRGQSDGYALRVKKLEDLETHIATDGTILTILDLQIAFFNKRSGNLLGIVVMIERAYLLHRELLTVLMTAKLWMPSVGNQ